MNFDLILAGIVTVSLTFYLIYALLRPENL